MLREDNVGWSAEEDRRLARMWCADEPPASQRDIADALDKSKSAVARRVAALNLRGKKGDRAHYERITGVALEPILRPVRVDLPPTPSGEPLPPDYSMLVWGDTQFPFHEPRAIDILYQITRDLSPEILVCLGDIFDFYELSDYRSKEDKEPDLQETFDLSVAHLAKMVKLAEPSEAYFLAGNHEDRWHRFFDKAKRDSRFRQLLKLPSIKRALTFEEVAGFSDLGYSYQPYMEGQHVLFEDKLLITHGDRTNKYAARSMLDRYGTSVIFGHTHRIQTFTRRDLRGQEAGFNIGCLCDLDPHYGVFADWQLGFAVVTFRQGLFNVEIIRIHLRDSGEAVALWRDKVYTSHS